MMPNHSLFRLLIPATFFCTMVAIARAEAPAIVTIENDTLRVSFDSKATSFSAERKTDAKPFLVDAKLSAGENPSPRAIAAHDPALGDGSAIELTYANGNRDMISVFPNLPFVLIRRTLHNGTSAATVTDKISLLSAAVDLDKPADQLKVLGTGGLFPAKDDVGSYVWLAAAEPHTRHGVVAAWLTHERGGGVLFSKAVGSQLRIDAQIDYGRLRIAPQKDAETETLAIGCFDDARLGLEQWADAVATVSHIHLHLQPTGYCTWYSDKHGGASDAKDLAALAEFAAKELKPFGFDFVQIDDGWQSGEKSNGPRKNFTGHSPTGPYPQGMKATADGIKALGLTPGIWFMPFAGTAKDPFFANHMDWFAKTADGKPFETAWGGTCLDMTDPGAREYVRSVVHRIAHEWGYTYFKMDGMYTGAAVRQVYVNSKYKEDHIGESVLHDPDKTNIQTYRDGIRLVRETAGDGVFILGCCAPQNMRSYGGAFGLVDAMRIGPDNNSKWPAIIRGPEFGTRNYFLNGRIWYNDPDPMYVRASIPLEHAQLIATWVTISGQLSASSDWLPGLPPERLNVLKRTMPSNGLPARPIDLFENNMPTAWLLSDTRQAPRRDVVAFYNWKDEPGDFDFTFAQLGLDADKTYYAFDFWGNKLVGPFKGHLTATLPKQSCQDLALRPVSDHPQLISTSRHITQGIVDVTGETWNPAEQTLSGTSKVVAGDPYELRIVTGSSGSALAVESVEVTPALPGKPSVKEEPLLARITLPTETSREIHWVVRFKK